MIKLYIPIGFNNIIPNALESLEIQMTQNYIFSKEIGC